MNKNMIFRILGIVSGVLIIAGVFLPLVSVTGYVKSLMELNKEAIYLPIMLICFGVINIVCFALNKKTEVSYSTAGALLFYMITQLVEVIRASAFDTCGIGFYFLMVGTVLAAIASIFSTNKKEEKSITQTMPEMETQTSVLDKIDNLYNDNNQMMEQNQISPIQTVQNIQPIQPVQPSIAPIQPVQQMNVEPALQPLNSLAQPVQSVVEPVQQVQPVQPNVEPVQPVQPVQSVQPNVEPVQQVQQVQPVEPVVEPVQSVEQTQQPVNPVVAQFEAPQQPNVEHFGISDANPVVQEFSNSTPSKSQPENQSSGLDIFGQ